MAAWQSLDQLGYCWPSQKFQGCCHIEFKFIHGKTGKQKLCRQRIQVSHNKKQDDRINESVSPKYVGFLFEGK